MFLHSDATSVCSDGATQQSELDDVTLRRSRSQGWYLSWCILSLFDRADHGGVFASYETSIMEVQYPEAVLTSFFCRS